MEEKAYIPGWGSVVGFRSIVVAFTVSADEEQFVDSVACSTLIEIKKRTVKTLPLSQTGVGVTFGAVGLIDQAKVVRGLC